MRLRVLVLLALLAAVLATAPAQGAPTATGIGGAAATVDRHATNTALAVLRQDGNAIDAAIAAAATLGVTEPYVAGIGGGGFMVIYLADKRRVVTIDGRETAPSAFTATAFVDSQTGKPIPFTEAVTSGLAVGAPGTLATWDSAAKKYGTKSLGRLLRPAIALARKGFKVDQTFRDQTEANRARLNAFSSSRALFLDSNGQSPAVGSTLRNTDLANAYTQIANRGTGVLYGGGIGRAIVAAVAKPPLAPDAQLGFTVRPGPMTLSDLRGYRTIERKPTKVRYRDYDVYGMGPPSSGGSTVGEALNILEGFSLRGSDRELALHRYLEASRLAYADRNRWVGDPAFVNVPLSGLLSEGFARERRCLIGTSAGISPVGPGEPFSPYATACAAGTSAAASGPEGTSTNHLTVADKFGNVVAYTTTIEQIAGNGMVVPRYGFLLNNELTDFNFAPPPAGFPGEGVPDPNLPAARKRPRSSMAPTIVLRDGKPVLALGSPGGSRIITTVLQTLLNRFDFGMSLANAVAAPRAAETNIASTLVEPAFNAQYGAALGNRFGQRFALAPEPIGAVTAVEFLARGRMRAVAEPTRRGGGSAGVVRR